MIKRYLLCLLILTLSACGFHLRGAYHWPQAMLPVYLDYQDTPAEFVTKFKPHLQASGLPTTQQQQQAQTYFIISNPHWQQEEVSVNTQAGSRELLLSYTISYQVLDKERKALSQNQRVRTQQTVNFVNNQLVSSEQRVAATKQQLQTQAMRQLLTRLHAAINQHETTS